MITKIQGSNVYVQKYADTQQKSLQKQQSFKGQLVVSCKDVEKLTKQSFEGLIRQIHFELTDLTKCFCYVDFKKINGGKGKMATIYFAERFDKVLKGAAEILKEPINYITKTGLPERGISVGYRNTPNRPGLSRATAANRMVIGEWCEMVKRSPIWQACHFE